MPWIKSYTPDQATAKHEELKDRVRNITADPVSGLKAFAQFEPFDTVTNPGLAWTLTGPQVERRAESSWMPKPGPQGTAQNGTLGMIAHYLATLALP